MTRGLGIVGLGLWLAVSCGGKQETSTPVGQGHAVDRSVDAPSGTRGSEGASDGGAFSGTSSPDAGTELSGGPMLTLELANTSDSDLNFSMNAGWQPILSAWSGTPPNAQSILLFPKHCTASCDAAKADRCPYCPRPRTAREEKAARKWKVVAPGTATQVPWKGDVYVYETTKFQLAGRTKTCECYRTQPVPQAEYTVRACGMRLTKRATSTSKLQCTTTKASLPSAPQTVRFEFGNR